MDSPGDRKNKRVAIVGGGAAGLTAIKACLEEGNIWRSELPYGFKSHYTCYKPCSALTDIRPNFPLVH